MEKKIEEGERAKITWEKKTLFEKTRNELSNCLTELNSLASGIPIKEIWVNGLGNEFVDSLNTLVLEPNPDNVTHARTKLYGKSLDKLVLAWKNARDLEIKIKDCMKDIEKIPSKESRVIDWWN